MTNDHNRTFALVGPGRAGTSLALALAAAGHRPVAVAGRAVTAPSTRTVAQRLGVGPVATAGAGVGAAVVLVATPDADLAATARTLAPGLERDALVVHCSGASGLDVFADLRAARPDVRVGSLHPLQTFAAPDPDRLAGAWAAVAGPPEVAELALAMGLVPFVVAEAERARYHAAAVVASNHLVALLGQVERLAASAGVPVEAFWPLVRASVDNVAAVGPAPALTGPVARGDVATVGAHLAALPDDEHDAYRALARSALALTGRDDPAMLGVLGPADGVEVEVGA